MNKIKFVVIIGITLLVVGVIGSFITYHSLDHTTTTITETVTANQIEILEIQSKNENVSIIPINNSNEITVELKSAGTKNSKTELDLQVDGDQLFIRTVIPNKFFNINFFDGSSKLNIYLPQKVYQSLFVDIDNGTLKMNDVKIHEIQADTDNGEIRLENITSDSMAISAINGNVHLSHVDGAITGQINNGNLTIKTKSLDRSIEWKVDNGNIVIETEIEPTNTILDFQTKNGKITVFGDEDWVPVFGAGENVLKLRTDNGDIKIEK